MTGTNLIMLALALPLGGALAISLLGQWENIRETAAIVTGIVLFLVVCALIPEVSAGGRPGWVVANMLPGAPLAFQLEPLGLLFALVASGLWIVTTVYSIGYMRGHHEQNQTRFYTCFAVAIFAAMGAALSANLLTLFVFYELMTLSTYPLVTHHGTDKARRAGRVYLGILLGTSVCFFLLAMVWTWVVAGTLEFRPGGILGDAGSTVPLALLLGLFAFGTGKAALMPFHRWLPAAMVAPTPVSALLHAVAVVKVGVFTVLKIVVYIFGIETLTSTGASIWLQYVAGTTILLASLVALTRNNLKERLAYSTISQLSYIVLGAMLANSWGVIGGGMHIVMHAFGKITLFFCAGAIYVAAHKTEVSELDGLGRTMPITFGAFAIAAISVIGLPPLGGSWSKWYLALGAAEAGQIALVATLMISSLLNILYLMPIPIRGFFAGERTNSGIKEAPWPSVLALSFTAMGSIALFFFATPIYELLKPIAGLTP